MHLLCIILLSVLFSVFSFIFKHIFVSVSIDYMYIPNNVLSLYYKPLMIGLLVVRVFAPASRVVYTCTCACPEALRVNMLINGLVISLDLYVQKITILFYLSPPLLSSPLLSSPLLSCPFLSSLIVITLLCIYIYMVTHTQTLISLHSFNGVGLQSLCMCSMYSCIWYYMYV